MGTLILPDWNYPGFRTRMTDAARWTTVHGFTRGTEFVNCSGEKLAELLDSEPNVAESGTVYPRWTFPDGSACRSMADARAELNSDLVPANLSLRESTFRRCMEARGWVCSGTDHLCFD